MNFNFFAACALCSFCTSLFAQGTFLVDQQDNGGAEFGYVITSSQTTIGQSFMPQATSMNYAEFEFYGNGATPVNGSAVSLNLRIISPTNGPILASSGTVIIPNSNSGGHYGFLFSNPVPLIPGGTYYLQLAFQGDVFVGVSYHNSAHDYLGGNEFGISSLFAGTDLWFREGLLIPAPEPETLGLGLLGVGVFYFARRRGRKVGA